LEIRNLGITEKSGNHKVMQGQCQRVAPISDLWVCSSTSYHLPAQWIRDAQTDF